MKCAFCDDKKCYSGKDCAGVEENSRLLISEKENHDIMRIAASLEADHYMSLCRVEETLEFAKNLGIRRIGAAFCIGLAAEARLFCEIAEARGFKTLSVCCKVGGIDKGEMGFKKLWDRKIEATCNPAGQAMVLDRSGSELNVAIGLCVGHDSIFFKYSKAPATVLIAKDRLLAHNPAGALYSNYYSRRLNGELQSLEHNVRDND